MVLQIICLVFLAFAGLVVAYYALLAIVGLIWVSDIQIDPLSLPRHDFAIIVPAHDEEQVIAVVLKSLGELDYPTHKFKVFVVADNCTDRTADVVRQNSHVCLERHDERLRGKGFALAWAFQQIALEAFDGIVIVDADCDLAPHALRAFDQQFSLGAKVLQAEYVATNPDDNVISYAVGVGNVMENRFYYAPKSVLGLAVFLRGTGMALHRDVLARHPWDAFSIVEDTEYSLRLIRDGIHIRFLPGVWVKTMPPVASEQLKVQRARWADNLRIGRVKGAHLMWEGLIRRSLPIIDAGWSLLTISRPIVYFQVLLTMALGILCVYLKPGDFSNWLLGLAALFGCLQLACIGAGILYLGINGRRLGLLLVSPVVMLRLIGISIGAMIARNPTTWKKTPRRGP